MNARKEQKIEYSRRIKKIKGDPFKKIFKGKIKHTKEELILAQRELEGDL